MPTLPTAARRPRPCAPSAPAATGTTHRRPVDAPDSRRTLMIRTDDEASGDDPGAPPVVWQPPPSGAQSTGSVSSSAGLSASAACPSTDTTTSGAGRSMRSRNSGTRYGSSSACRPAGYSSVLSSRVMPGGRWFEGARLNYAEAVLAGAPQDRPALIAVAEQQPPREISRAELRGQVGALAAALRELGVGPGDRVAAYLPNIRPAGWPGTSSSGACCTAAPSSSTTAAPRTPPSMPSGRWRSRPARACSAWAPPTRPPAPRPASPCPRTCTPTCGR